MDIPPAIEYQIPVEQTAKIEVNTIDLYKYYVLDRIDSSDIPDAVKQFAKENNCMKIMKKYYWSYKLFKDKGGVYVCGKNGKTQYILEYKNKLRLAKWYEKYKFQHTTVYEN